MSPTSPYTASFRCHTSISANAAQIIIGKLLNPVNTNDATKNIGYWWVEHIFEKLLTDAKNVDSSTAVRFWKTKTVIVLPEAQGLQYSAPG